MALDGQASSVVPDGDVQVLLFDARELSFNDILALFVVQVDVRRADDWTASVGTPEIVLKSVSVTFGLVLPRDNGERVAGGIEWIVEEAEEGSEFVKQGAGKRHGRYGMVFADSASRVSLEGSEQRGYVSLI